MKYEITLRMTVEADSPDDAIEIGVGAADHLRETFNDDGSIDQFITVDSRPVEADAQG